MGKTLVILDVKARKLSSNSVDSILNIVEGIELNTRYLEIEYGRDPKYASSF